MEDDIREGAEEPTASGTTPGDLFISYRRDDASGQATALKHALAERFGAEQVFMDVADLRPGENFVRVIRQHVSHCDVLIALIGRNWTPIMEERSKRRALDFATDYVRVELEEALRRESSVRVLPVLLDGAVMPAPDHLPRPLRALCEINAAELRHSRWDDDVHALIERIEEIFSSRPEAAEEIPDDEVVTEQPVPEQVVADDVVRSEPRPVSRTPAAPPPDASHYAAVARQITRGNAVIPFLGPGVNHADDSPRPNNKLTFGDELAAHLAQEFDYEAEPADLAEISQYVLLTMGKVDLYKALRKILTASYPPGPVHRLLAGLPETLEEQGHEERYQLIATINYDDALEQAFEQVGEPYDLAVYMAQGEHKGKFLHVPAESEPRVVSVPNDYVDFPIDEYGNVERTVILKVHGAVDRLVGASLHERATSSPRTTTSIT